MFRLRNYPCPPSSRDLSGGCDNIEGYPPRKYVEIDGGSRPGLRCAIDGGGTASEVPRASSADPGEASREMMSGALAGLVFILVKDDVDHTNRRFGKLLELQGR